VPGRVRARCDAMQSPGRLRPMPARERMFLQTVWKRQLDSVGGFAVLAIVGACAQVFANGLQKRIEQGDIERFG
jgi:hypothetical protein